MPEWRWFILWESAKLCFSDTLKMCFLYGGLCPPYEVQQCRVRFTHHFNFSKFQCYRFNPTSRLHESYNGAWNAPYRANKWIETLFFRYMNWNNIFWNQFELRLRGNKKPPAGWSGVLKKREKAELSAAAWPTRIVAAWWGGDWNGWCDIVTRSISCRKIIYFNGAAFLHEVVVDHKCNAVLFKSWIL